MKQLANIILLIIMLGAVYTHYALHDKLDRMAPGVIFSLLLITRLIIYQQGKSSNLNIKKENDTEKLEDQETLNDKKKD
jgi:hypothetical protein